LGEAVSVAYCCDNFNGAGRPARRFLAALLALAAPACDIQYTPSLSDHAIMPDYSLAVRQSLAGHTVMVEVHGNPFAVPPQAFAGQVAANMNQSGAAPARFTGAPSTATTPYRVVWNFAPPHESIAPNAICRGQDTRSNEIGESIDAYAAFCRGDVALSSVRGRLYYTETQNSIAFLRLVDTMTAQLFPTDPTGLRRPGGARLGERLSHPF
jgi:hypothetical protein